MGITRRNRCIWLRSVGRGGLIVALLLGFALTLANPGVANAAGFKGRKYYLTQGTFDGSQALTACEKGFHMASILEILDVTSLSYNLELGIGNFDMGSGPPSNLAGWVRTGFVSNGSATPGQGNCFAWTSNDGGQSGTRVFLPTDWTIAGTVIAPWVTNSTTCDNPLAVWCVSDK